MARKIETSYYVEFEHAVAGHEGVLCDESGSIIVKPCRQEEVDFYESCAGHPTILKFMPTFLGTLTASPTSQEQIDSGLSAPPLSLKKSQTVLQSVPSSGTNTPLPTEVTGDVKEVPSSQLVVQQAQLPWVPSGGKRLDTGLSIVLENIAAGFRRPNVLDVKLGARLWADDAVSGKRSKLDEVANGTTSGTLGFRIAGMKVWEGEDQGSTEPEAVVKDTPAVPYPAASDEAKSKAQVVKSGGYCRYDRWYGRLFTEDNVKEGFEKFLACAKAGKSDRSKLVAERMAKGLRDIQAALESEESRMYSSSVLMVYEGDSEAIENALEEETEIEERSQISDDASLSGETDGGSGSEVESFILQSTEVTELQAAAGNITQMPISTETTLVGDLTELTEDEEEEPPKVHDLRLIDFAHASWEPGQGPDENVLKGVRNLAKIMEQLAGIAN